MSSILGKDGAAGTNERWGRGERILVAMLVRYELLLCSCMWWKLAWDVCACLLLYRQAMDSAGLRRAAGQAGRFYLRPHIFNGIIIDEITRVLVGQAMSIFIISFLLFIFHAHE
jgi:hypothetical protein